MSAYSPTGMLNRETKRKVDTLRHKLSDADINGASKQERHTHTHTHVNVFLKKWYRMNIHRFKKGIYLVPFT